jgi:glycosyltransferase
MIGDAIKSVLGQDCPGVEYIIVDGGSTDSTLEIIKSYGSRINKMISEPDKGIYDAMNKGIKLASGDIVGILNSDDVYADNMVLSEVVEMFRKTGADAVYGDLVYVGKDDASRVVRYWRAGQYRPGNFRKGWHPAHPALFVKRQVYEKCGGFDTSFSVSADFELMLRLFEKHKIKTVYLPKVLVKMRLGGESNRALGNIIKGNLNILRAFWKNGIFVTPFYTIRRLFSKIEQFYSHTKNTPPSHQ